jgi:hypothetical protein
MCYYYTDTSDYKKLQKQMAHIFQRSITTQHFNSALINIQNKNFESVTESECIQEKLLFKQN